jgi:ribosomal protein S18 acetylase RimI-like enzyme
MARSATYIDFKRIQRNFNLYNLSREAIENIYLSSFMTISSNDSFSFCYPIKYWDGLLIRYNSADIRNCVDMVIELSERLPGKIYIPDRDEDFKDELWPQGFKEYLNIYSVYKKSFYLPKKTCNFYITDYLEKYYKQIRSLDEETFSFPRVTSFNDLPDFIENNYSRVKICIQGNTLCGFCLYILKPVEMYFYIVKMYVGTKYRRMGIGTHLLKSVIDESKKYGCFPVFSDVFSDEPQPFLNYADFTTWGESKLLIRL